MNELKRLYMLQICDSLFPIGAFTLSNGLETYVQHGAVHSPETLAAHEVDRQEALSIYGYSLLSGLTTHAAKCVPLRQLEAQRVLRESFPQLLEAVRTALSVTEDEIGVGGPAFDIFAMQHETLYSRLYMS